MYIPDGLFERIGDYKCSALFIILIRLSYNKGYFASSYRELSNIIGIPSTTVYRNIQRLKNLGAIQVNTSNKKVVISIVNIAFYKSHGTATEQSGTKRNNLGTKENTITNSDAGSCMCEKSHVEQQRNKEEQRGITLEQNLYEIINGIKDEDFKNAVILWLKYKKEKKQTYKTMGLKALITKLMRMSSNNPKIAMSIVENSISNNYSGLFDVRKENIGMDKGVIIQDTDNKDYSKGW